MLVPAVILAGHYCALGSMCSAWDSLPCGRKYGVLLGAIWHLVVFRGQREGKQISTLARGYQLD